MGLAYAKLYIGLGKTSGRFDSGISLLQTTADYTVLILHRTARQATLCESNVVNKVHLYCHT